MLDDLDLRALALLQRNARITNRQLAAELGRSESACWNRLRRLEEIGAIVGYTAILGPVATGGAIRAWIDVRLTDERPIARVALEATARELAGVVAMYEVAGQGDYLIKIRAPDMERANAVWTGLEQAGAACQVVRRSVILRDVKPLWSGS